MLLKVMKVKNIRNHFFLNIKNVHIGNLTVNRRLYKDSLLTDTVAFDFVSPGKRCALYNKNTPVWEKRLISLKIKRLTNYTLKTYAAMVIF